MRTATNPVETYQMWLARAERAHRIAGMLSSKDARAVEDYAAECEAKAREHFSGQARQQLAA